MTKKVSFYSFKGGTGRSTGLSNVAYALAEEGYSVGCIDFDVEAAGLNYIFEIPPGYLDEKKKVQHYLIPSERNQIGSINECVLDLHEIKFDGDIPGELYLIPAETDADLTSQLGPTEGLFPHIEELFNEFDGRYALDYLLVDSRSGVSNFALPSLVMADEIAVFFRWTQQHREGTAATIPWLRQVLAGLNDQPPDVLAVGSNIPDRVDEAEIGEWVENYLDVVRGWNVIRETELLKTREQILVHTEPDSETAAAYRELAAAL